MRTKYATAFVALCLISAAAGAGGEALERFSAVSRWQTGTPEQRGKQLHGSAYHELIAYAQSRVSPGESCLLVSDWDPALIPYYLHPRRIYQRDVQPEITSSYMRVPPSPYPRRPVESFDVDWAVRLRDTGGTLVPEFWKLGPREVREGGGTP